MAIDRAGLAKFISGIGGSSTQTATQSAPSSFGDLVGQIDSGMSKTWSDWTSGKRAQDIANKQYADKRSSLVPAGWQPQPGSAAELFVKNGMSPVDAYFTTEEGSGAAQQIEGGAGNWSGLAYQHGITPGSMGNDFGGTTYDRYGFQDVFAAPAYEASKLIKPAIGVDDKTWNAALDRGLAKHNAAGFGGYNASSGLDISLQYALEDIANSGNTKAKELISSPEWKQFREKRIAEGHVFADRTDKKHQTSVLQDFMVPASAFAGLLAGGAALSGPGFSFFPGGGAAASGAAASTGSIPWSTIMNGIRTLSSGVNLVNTLGGGSSTSRVPTTSASGGTSVNDAFGPTSGGFGTVAPWYAKG